MQTVLTNVSLRGTGIVRRWCARWTATSWRPRPPWSPSCGSPCPSALTRCAACAQVPALRSLVAYILRSQMLYVDIWSVDKQTGQEALGTLRVFPHWTSGSGPGHANSVTGYYPDVREVACVSTIAPLPRPFVMPAGCRCCGGRDAGAACKGGGGRSSALAAKAWAAIPRQGGGLLDSHAGCRAAAQLMTCQWA